MAKIPFDIKFRPQIESGEYSVETEAGLPVTVMDWEYNAKIQGRCIAVKITEGGTDSALLYTTDGKRASIFPVEGSNLILITPEPELTEFELKVHEILYSDKPEYSASDPESWKQASSELLALAKKEIEKDLPRWVDDGLQPGCGAINISGLCGFDFLRRNGKLLSVSAIEKLPGFKEDEK